jgi:gamma-glutamylcyclotransferase (GGCT)/AIG2-like uncharacterized protein YtfP
MNLVFVYGSLKRGFSNHHFLAGQNFVTVARTGPGFRLYALTGYPGMVPDPSAKEGIEGEVWEVDDAALTQLDELEGLAEGLYRRETITLAPPFAATPVQTYLYAQDVSGRRDAGTVWEEK